MAEYYSAELAEKVIRGLTENALKCKVNGGQVPFGYFINTEQKLEPEPTCGSDIKLLGAPKLK